MKMNEDLIDELIAFFEGEKAEVQIGGQFTVEELDTILDALSFYRNRDYI